MHQGLITSFVVAATVAVGSSAVIRHPLALNADIGLGATMGADAVDWVG